MSRRLPESEIVRIKTETDLIALIESRGIKLKRQGSNWTGLCPFHEDRKTPNLIVTPGKGLFRCMAAGCGKSGNAIQFVQWHDGVSFRHAFELLTNGGKAAFEHSSGQTRVATVPKLPCPLEAKAGDAELMEQVVSYYHERLKQSKPALDYLASRGLDDERLVQRFRLGFADRTLGLRLPHRNRAAGEQLRGALARLGVYRKSGHEHLTGCLVVPVLDPGSGEVRQLYGRRIERTAPKNKRHLYLARPLAGIFNADALQMAARAPGGELILAESILDALTFFRHGMEAVTCTFGTSNFTPELFAAIEAAKIESVRLAFDGDESGEAAAEQASQRLQAIGIECHRIKFPWGSDANAFALKKGGEALKRAVNSAQWLGAGVSPTGTGTSSLLAAKSAAKEEKPRGTGGVLDRSESDVPAGRAAGAAAASQKVLPAPEVAAELNGSAKAEVEKRGDYHTLKLGDRLYRVGGLEKNGSLEVLKITLRVLEPGGLFHVDSLDLYRDGERRKFIERAAEETNLEKALLKRDLGKLLLALEALQEERLAAPLETDPQAVQLTTAEEAEALALLRAPDLLGQLTQAFHAAGIVGEETNVLAAYLACASRKLAKPLAVIIQSTSAAGKTTLMEAVLSFFPEEDQVKYSAMTGQSLYYLGESNLKHKILAIVEEEGAEKASYALKLLQSEGELTIASTGKDPHSGRMETQEYHVEGPVAIVFTTTSIDIDEELMNRCLVLTVDESKEQTERIHELQREARTIEGILAAEERKDVLRVMQNAQRLLQPWRIANPFARELTFTSGRTRTRRDHEKYLTLIDAIALLHQHQRQPVTHKVNGREVSMLPVTLADIEAANKIAPEVLGRSLDELPPQTRRLLEHAKELVRARMKEKEVEQRLCHFSRKELREKAGWSEFQIRTHLDRLESMEYLSRRQGRQGALCLYELLIDAEEPEGAWHVGLIDVAKLRGKKSKRTKSQEPQLAGAGN